MNDDGSRGRRGGLRAGIALCLVVATAASLALTALATTRQSAMPARSPPRRPLEPSSFISAPPVV